MKELSKNELQEVEGGWARLVGVFLGGLAYELVTEGFAKCAADFRAGYQSTQ